MKKNKAYIVAFLACAGIIILYLVIGAIFFGWERGGGVLPLMILFGVIGTIWKGIIGLSKEKESKDKTNNTYNENNNAT